MATKYVSSLTGSEMDSALLDMAYHNSEAYAVGTRNGVDVGSSDVTYHNNSKYYAEQVYGYTDRAEDAAARAEAAVPAGTAGAVFFDRAQSLTKAQQSQARANIMAGGTNPNLLDNAYFVGGGSQLGDGVFPINQRGQTSYTGGRNIDRWRCWNTSTVTLTAAGLTFATGANDDGLFQYFPKGKFESLYGETVTASLLLTDGTLYTATGTASADCWIAKSFSGGYFGYICNGTEANFRTSLDANQSKSIKAVKLEKGTYSTLANDVPPNFGEELAKCQRYLWFKTFSGNTQIGSGVALTADQAIVSVVTPASMRPAQNITLTANVLLVGNGQVATASAVTGINQYDNIARLTLSSSGLTAYHTYSFFTTTETTMAIYAEL